MSFRAQVDRPIIWRGALRQRGVPLAAGMLFLVAWWCSHRFSLDANGHAVETHGSELHTSNVAVEPPILPDIVHAQPEFVHDPQLVEAQGLLLGKRQLDAAALLLAEVVRKTPGDPLAWTTYAMAEVSRGRLQAGIAAYRQALDLEPRQPTVCNDLAWLLATHPDPRQRRPQEAVTLARQAISATDGTRVEFLNTLAVADAAAGNFAEARDTLRMVMAVLAESDDPKRAEQRAICRLRSERLIDPEMTAGPIERLLHSMPLEIRCEPDWWRVLQAASDVLRFHPEAWIADPMEAEALAVLAEKYAGRGARNASSDTQSDILHPGDFAPCPSLPPNLDPATARRAEVMMLIAERLTAESSRLAASVCYAALGEWPEHPRLVHHLASLLLEHNQPQAAADVLQQSEVAGSSESTELLKLTAMVRVRQGRLAEGIRIYRRLLSERAFDAEVANDLAWLLATASRPTDEDVKLALEIALLAFRASGERSPTYADTLAVVLAAAGRFPEAVEHEQRALHLLADAPGDASRLAQRYRARLKSFQRNLVWGQQAPSHAKLGSILLAEGRLESAAEELLNSLQHYPRQPKVLAQLGQVRVLQGRRDEAIRWYLAALEQQANWPEVANDTAWLLATRSQPTVNEIRLALRLSKLACDSASPARPEFERTRELVASTAAELNLAEWPGAQ